jgi:hypothetical protein
MMDDAWDQEAEMSEQRLRPFTDEEETEEARHDWVPREPAAHEFERRAAKAHDHEGNLVGYYIDADTWREIRASLTAAVVVADPADTSR